MENICPILIFQRLIVKSLHHLVNPITWPWVTVGNGWIHPTLVMKKEIHIMCPLSKTRSHILLQKRTSTPITRDVQLRINMSWCRCNAEEMWCSPLTTLRDFSSENTRTCMFSTPRAIKHHKTCAIKCISQPVWTFVTLQMPRNTSPFHTKGE